MSLKLARYRVAMLQYCECLSLVITLLHVSQSLLYSDDKVSSAVELLRNASDKQPKTVPDPIAHRDQHNSVHVDILAGCILSETKIVQVMNGSRTHQVP